MAANTKIIRMSSRFTCDPLHKCSCGHDLFYSHNHKCIACRLLNNTVHYLLVTDYGGTTVLHRYTKNDYSIDNESKLALEQAVINAGWRELVLDNGKCVQLHPTEKPKVKKRRRKHPHDDCCGAVVLVGTEDFPMYQYVLR